MNDHWCQPYIGMPWVAGSYGPESYDCWSLIWEIYRTRYGVDLPNYREVSRQFVRSISLAMRSGETGGEWVRVYKPREGDLVAMSRSKRYHHVGIYIEFNGGQVLHAADRDRVIVQPVGSISRGIWSKIHYYRHHTKIYED